MFTENEPPYNVIVNENHLQAHPYKTSALDSLRSSASRLWLVGVMFFVQFIGYYLGYSFGYDQGVIDAVEAPVNFAFRPLEPLMTKLEVVDELTSNHEPHNLASSSASQDSLMPQGEIRQAQSVAIKGKQELESLLAERPAQNARKSKEPSVELETEIVAQALIDDSDRILDKESDNKIAKIVLSEVSKQDAQASKRSQLGQNSEKISSSASLNSLRARRNHDRSNAKKGQILVTTKHLGVLEDGSENNSDSNRAKSTGSRIKSAGQATERKSLTGQAAASRAQTLRRGQTDSKRASPNLAPGYYVQVAVAATKKDATLTMNKLKRSGFPAIIEESRSENGDLSYYRVLLGPEANRTISERMSAQVAREPYIRARPFVRLLD